LKVVRRSFAEKVTKRRRRDFYPWNGKRAKREKTWEPNEKVSLVLSVTNLLRIEGEGGKKARVRTSYE